MTSLEQLTIYILIFIFGMMVGLTIGAIVYDTINEENFYRIANKS